jgi:hypothetical protein
MMARLGARNPIGSRGLMYSETRLDSRTTPQAVSGLRIWLRQAWLVQVSAVLALVFAVYGRVTTQPLYWDDGGQYSFATENSLLKIWLNQIGYADHRSALFTLYKAALTYLTPYFTAVRYAVGLILHAANCILVGYLAAEPTRWSQARARPGPAPAQTPSVFRASFEKQVFLASGDYSLTGETLTVTLNWLDFSAERGLTVFRHVLDCQGNQLGQGDGYVPGRALPFGLLPQGAALHDVRAISVRSLPADGCFLVQVGLYRPDGSRLGAFTAQGARFDTGAAAINAQKGSQ